jgi:hypothetical protein
MEHSEANTSESGVGLEPTGLMPEPTLEEVTPTEITAVLEMKPSVAFDGDRNLEEHKNKTKKRGRKIALRSGKEITISDGEDEKGDGEVYDTANIPEDEEDKRQKRDDQRFLKNLNKFFVEDDEEEEKEEKEEDEDEDEKEDESEEDGEEKEESDPEDDEDDEDEVNSPTQVHSKPQIPYFNMQTLIALTCITLSAIIIGGLIASLISDSSAPSCGIEKYGSLSIPPSCFRGFEVMSTPFNYCPLVKAFFTERCHDVIRKS